MILLAVLLVAAAIVLAVSIYRDLHPKQAGLPRSMESLLASTGKLWLLMILLFPILVVIYLIVSISLGDVSVP